MVQPPLRHSGKCGRNPSAVDGKKDGSLWILDYQRIMAGYQRTFWSAAATPPRCLPEPTVLSLSRGSAKWHHPAAALDLARYPFPAKVSRPGESAVAAARVEPKCPDSRPTPLVSPVAEVSSSRAVLPAHSKAVRNP